MNRFIIVSVIGIVLLAGGVYFYNKEKNSDNSPQMGGHNMEETNTKSVAQSHRSYELKVTSNTEGIKPKQPITFTYKIKNDKGEILKNYEVAHEKNMHFIIVRKDLQEFQHLHPDFNQSTGEFSIQVTFSSDGVYRIFPDFTPGDENPMKLPVTLNQDINVGDVSEFTMQPVQPDASPTKAVDGYSIEYKLNPEKPKTQTDFTYTLKVLKNGQPVTDLETYLGALGHSVILKEGTLDFIHTHAGEVNTGPDINFSTTFPESGIYKLFTQFQHQGKVQTTDYIINVQ